MIYTFIALIIGVFLIGYYNKAEIQISPIIGIMTGILYSFTDFEEGREHTFQFCLFFLSITIIWISPPNG